MAELEKLQLLFHKCANQEGGVTLQDVETFATNLVKQTSAAEKEAQNTHEIILAQKDARIAELEKKEATYDGVFSREYGTQETGVFFQQLKARIRQAEKRTGKTKAVIQGRSLFEAVTTYKNDNLASFELLVEGTDFNNVHELFEFLDNYQRLLHRHCQKEHPTAHPSLHTDALVIEAGILSRKHLRVGVPRSGYKREKCRIPRQNLNGLRQGQRKGARDYKDT